ncbi:MAG: DNA alkylation repair protein, partial [Planctomycetes bacterium]|nr:DNA alkylation repair protein [Planctomycetota bacterium]
MTATEIVKQLQPLSTDSYKRILLNHGAREPVLGVKIEELKKIQKRVKNNYRLACDLYDTGIYDAQYLAGLIADETQMTKKDLRHWLAKGNCLSICGTVVAWVAAESRHGRELALDWIESKKEITAQTGWATLGGLVAVTDDSALDLDELKRLLERVEQTIHQQPNYVRYTMNAFVIALGTYVPALTQEAL